MIDILVGKRLKLVPLERHHLGKRVDFINDHIVQANLNFDYPTSNAKTESWFSKIIVDRDRVDFALESIDDGLVIGFGGFLSLDRRVLKAELYIFIGDRDFWGKGYGRDGYKLLVNYGFEELGLQKVYLHQLTTNSRAVSATRALGWTVEGLLRQDIYSHGQVKDQFILSILRNEWESNLTYKDV